MIPLNDPQFASLSRRLRRFRARETITWIAALFTYPEYQANTARLEVLLHLAVANCEGVDRPTLKDINRWLNHDLGATFAAIVEDPPEDVFVSNILTPWGNARILEGLWERADFNLQQVLDLMRHPQWQSSFRVFRPHFRALLLLSEAVMERLKIQRWTKEDSSPRSQINLTPSHVVRERARALLFSREDLDEMSITNAAIAPFTFSQTERVYLLSETTGHTALERRPLIHFGDALLLASPTSVSVALRRMLLEWSHDEGLLPLLTQGLRLYQGYLAFNEGPLDVQRGDGVDHLVSKPDDLQIDDIIVRFDGNKFLHIVLLHDDLEETLTQGLGSVSRRFGGPQEKLSSYLHETANRLRAAPGNQGGMTILVFGGLGRGCGAFDVKFPAEWIYSHFRLADFLDLAADDSRELLRFFKLKRCLDEVERQGITYRHNSELNLFAFWKDQGFGLVPHEFPFPNPGGMIQIDGGFLATLRTKLRREMDVHILPFPNGTARVRRYRTQTLFSTDRERPLYADLDRLKDSGLLSVAVERKTVYWVRTRPPAGDEDLRDMAYRLWDAVATWADRLTEILETNFDFSDIGPVVVELDFSSIQTLKIDGAIDLERGKPVHSVLPEKSKVCVEISVHLMRLLATPTNVGERVIMRSISEGLDELLVSLGAARLNNVDHDALLDQIFGGSEARMVHFFETNRPMDYFDMIDKEKARFVADEDLRETTLGLAWRALGAPPAKESQLLDKQVAHECLKAMTLVLWTDIRATLQGLDRQAILQYCLSNKQALIADRNHWRRTSQAQVALHGRDEVLKVSGHRESDRALASLSCRVLVEMALCEAPMVGGMEIRSTTFDRLLAQVALMVEIGQDCDAVHAAIVPRKGGITVYPNGEYSIDRAFVHDIVNPFHTSFFESGFNQAVASYAELFERTTPRQITRVEDEYTQEFREAFEAEYGLSLAKFIDAMAELLDIAYEMKVSVVMAARNAVSDRIQTSRGLSQDELCAFFRAFGLAPRAAWDVPPKGYSRQDIQPWRFRRRLSLIARPIILVDGQEGNTIAYSVGVIASSTTHIIERLEAGWMHAEHFRSSKMKNYIGTISDKMGLKFGEDVATALRQQGYRCRTQVYLTELGGSASQGDIDVLAWRDDGPVFVIECKRLKPVKTIGEIVNLFEKFLGEDEELLRKHLRRVQWLRENLDGLCRATGRAVAELTVEQRLVTNAHVPLKFASRMPITPNTILSADELEHTGLAALGVAEISQ